MPLTPEQLNLIKREAEPIINSLEKKEAFLLVKQVEPLVASLEAERHEFFQPLRTLLWQLKWVAAPLLTDEDFQKLTRQGLLEGFALDDKFGFDFVNSQTADRLMLKFGVGAAEAVQETLSALRENTQEVGQLAVSIKNESRPARPSIRSWLVDFLRNTPSENPARMDETNYLFNNDNAKQLAETDRKTLSRVLAFHNSLKYAASQMALVEAQPIALPANEKETAGTRLVPEEQTPGASAPAQKTLRQLAQENKEALNQSLTAQPIKVADFDQPVRPTIKNWLVDYVKMKGAGRHENLERNDYLFSSPNAKALPEKERQLVAAILNAYDNDLPLPFSVSSQTIQLEKLTPPQEKQTIIPPAAARPTPGGRGAYREPITEDDLAGPLKQQAETKPNAKLSGNIIDLKDISDK